MNTVYHLSINKIPKFVNKPMWVFLDVKYLKCAYNNTINDGDNAFMYKIQIDGNFINENDAELILSSNNMNLDNYIEMLVSNPTSDEIITHDATSLLMNNHIDGIIHKDYNPCDYNQDIDTLLVFNPEKCVKDFQLL